MRIPWSKEKIEQLRQKLDQFEDAQATAPDEYVADFYDLDPPMTLELALTDQGVDVLAAEALAFDEEMDGWYLAGPVTDLAPIQAALEGLL